MGPTCKLLGFPPSYHDGWEFAALAFHEMAGGHEGVTVSIKRRIPGCPGAFTPSTPRIALTRDGEGDGESVDAAPKPFADAVETLRDMCTRFINGGERQQADMFEGGPDDADADDAPAGEWADAEDAERPAPALMS